MPPNPSRSIGSVTTPTSETVRAAATLLAVAVASARVARDAGLARLTRFHNAYVRHVAFYFMFASAARQCAVFHWRATFQPEHWFTNFSDKVPAPLRLPLPMLVPPGMSRQLALYQAHCSALLQRLTRRNLGSEELRRRLEAIGTAKDVTLLFHTKAGGDRLEDTGTSWTLNGFSDSIQLAPDSGRHYFSSYLHASKIPASLIDVYLRHADMGVEPLSSTSMVSLREAWNHVCPPIDAELERLALRPLAGLRQGGYD